MSKRYLRIVPEGDGMFQYCKKLGLPAFSGIADIAPGTITVASPDGTQQVLRLTDFDIVVIDTDMIDRASGSQRREEIVAHINAHGLRADEMYEFGLPGEREVITIW